MVALHESGGRLLRRQDLPPEAFFPAAKLLRLAEALGEDWFGWLFVALSYRWLAQQHPDEGGFHLAVVAEVGRLYLKALKKEVFKYKGLDEEPDFALFCAAPRSNRSTLTPHDPQQPPSPLARV